MAITLDDIKNMSPMRKALLISLLIILAGYLYYSCFYRDALEKRDRLESRFASLQREIAEKQAVVREIEKYKKELADLRERLRLAQIRLPRQKEIPALLDSISEVGRRLDLEFLLFQPAAVVPKEFYAEVPVKVQVAGGYHNTVLFFEKIAKLPRIVNITDLSIKKGKGKDNVDSLDISCCVKTYMFLGEDQKQGEFEESRK